MSGETSSAHPSGTRAWSSTTSLRSPFYDYGSVDEATRSTYNWGYDPVT